MGPLRVRPDGIYPAGITVGCRRSYSSGAGLEFRIAASGGFSAHGAAPAHTISGVAVGLALGLLVPIIAFLVFIMP